MLYDNLSIHDDYLFSGSTNYLLSQTENQPTAAGQETTTTPDVAVETLSNKDSDLFGGKVADNQNELSLTPTEDSTEFKGYWVSSTWNNTGSSENGNTEASTQGNDIGTIGVNLTDNNDDRVLQNFYDRSGEKTNQLDIEGYDNSSENNSDATGSQIYKYHDHIANVNISDQNNQQSNAFAYEGNYETTRTSNESSGTYGIQSNNYKLTDNKELKKITFNNEGELLKSYWSGQTVFESSTGTYQIIRTVIATLMSIMEQSITQFMAVLHH
ncbi:MAG: hypothetical protein KZQ70_15795 [gamma proteobacterium symbiont of Lucinoma myriamae]|nr:hypothetical protein [gamma proteobacterium symbiont of Lucinoma myriamae]